MSPENDKPLMTELAKSAYQTPLTVEEVVEYVHRKMYLLPAIQREFVWSPQQIVTLFDSLMRGYTIGSFLFWRVNKEKVGEYQFYEFIRDYHERDNVHNPKASVSGQESIMSILDGQQRITCFFLGLRGTYANRTPRKRKDSEDAFPKRKLYLNLLSKSDEFELIYDFRFLTPSEASEGSEKTFWFEVGKILDLRTPSALNNYLIENGLYNQTPERMKFASETLFRLFEAIHKDRVINYYLETSQDLDRVLNIFIRVNSGGTQLSYSDLLLSIAEAQWKSRDARDEITSFVDETNQVGEGFALNKDFVLKCCLVLTDIANIAFKVDNFNKSNMSTIETRWDDIKRAIRTSVDLASSIGYDSKTLTSNNALIPIAYYVMTEGNPSGFLHSAQYQEDRKRIGRWLRSALIKKAFSGQPDEVLRPIRKILKDSHNGFPYESITDYFKGTPKSLTFTEEDIQALILSSYSRDHTFSVLALLYPTLDYRNKFHIDHIFPKSFFRKRELRNKGIPESKLDLYIEKHNLLGNLQLLEGPINEEKSSTDFREWLEERYTDPDEKKEYLLKNYIPTDIDLSLSNFEQFIRERNELIQKRLREALI